MLKRIDVCIVHIQRVIVVLLLQIQRVVVTSWQMLQSSSSSCRANWAATELILTFRTTTHVTLLRLRSDASI